MYLYH